MRDNCDIRGKKLLVLGGVAMIMELVEDAKARGAYVIVTDYLSNSPAKTIADEAWQISTADTDSLAKMCIQKNVDGVISAFDDFNVICSARLSEQIKKPFYASLEQAESTMDKAVFKQLCRRHQVPSTPEFKINDSDIDSIHSDVSFPVIIKPIDGSGARGITICQNRDQLVKAWDFAKKTSKKNKVIVEKYIIGDEIGVNYLLQDGEIKASVLHDRYMQEDNGFHVRLPLAYVYPSKYTMKYLEEEDNSVRSMFCSMGMKNGTLFMQGCVDKDGLCYFYEMGYRINGAKQYQLLDALCGINPMQMIVNYSLTGKMAEINVMDRVQPMLSKECCTLSILARPGRVHQIYGLDEIIQNPATIAVTPWYREGDVIDENAVGTQKQICLRITLAADDKTGLAQAIEQVNKKLAVLDEHGDSLLLDAFDPQRLFE